MRKIFVSSIFIFSLITIKAQNAEPIVGKWKIISFDAGIYYNYKLDSTFVPDEIKESLKGSKDSLVIISLMKGMVKEFDNYFYEFFADSTFKETKDDKLKQEGTYVLNKKSSELMLIVKTKYNGGNRQKMNYKIALEVLEFTLPDVDTPIKIVLEQVK